MLLGNFYSTVKLLRILKLPATLDFVRLGMENPNPEDIAPMLGPQMEALLCDDVEFSKPLEVDVSISGPTQVMVSVTPRYSPREQWPTKNRPEKIFEIYTEPDARKQFAIDLLRLIPQTRVKALTMNHTPKISDEPFPELEELDLYGVDLSKDPFLHVYRTGTNSDTKLFPSLKNLLLVDVHLDNELMQPLKNFVKDQCSNKKYISLFVIQDSGCELSREKELEMIKEFKALGAERVHLSKDI